MKGRYLNPRNAWETSWNDALDRIEQLRLKKGANPELSQVDPYREAWKASDRKRIEDGVPQEEWNYELCERYTVIELETKNRLREWEKRYMPDEQSASEKRKSDRIKQRNETS